MNVLSLQQNDLIRLMRGRHMQRVIWVVNLLLVIWIASQLATLTWGLLEPAAAPEPVAVVAGDLPARADPGQQLIRELPEWHLMGVVTQQAAPVKQAAPVDAPDTRLKLVLRGALASDDKQHARAIIADPRGQEEQYSIGDTLPGNAELSEVYPDRVILMRNGRYETLRLPQDNKPGAGNSAASFSAGRQPAVSPAQRLQNMRQQLQKSPKSLYGLVRATPQKGEDGNIVGYVLAPGRDPELFEQVGLEEGDVVVQVNDIKLDNPANSARALKSVQSGESVSVTVLRGGEEQVLTLNLPE
jgi:general secretion pathway protein C